MYTIYPVAPCGNLIFKYRPDYISPSLAHLYITPSHATPYNIPVYDLLLCYVSINVNIPKACHNPRYHCALLVLAESIKYLYLVSK